MKYPTILREPLNGKKTSINQTVRKAITKIVTEKHFCTLPIGVSLKYNELEFLGVQLE